MAIKASNKFISSHKSKFLCSHHLRNLYYAPFSFSVVNNLEMGLTLIKGTLRKKNKVSSNQSSNSLIWQQAVCFGMLVVPIYIHYKPM